MKDRLSRLFQERFQGHEAPVDPGTWQAIQGQLTTPTTSTHPEPTQGKLQSKFAGHEVHVDSAVWQNISTQLGHGVAAGTAGGSGLLGGLGWAAAGVAGLLAVGGLIYMLNNADPAKPVLVEVAPTSITVETPTSVPPSATTATLAASNVGDHSESTAGTAAILTEPARLANINADTTTPVSTGAAPNEPTVAPSAESTPPTEKRSGVDVVNEIIAQMTTQVQQEVRSNPASTIPAATTGQSGSTPPEGNAPNEIVVEPTALPELFLPNTFTPNGDGVNDLYKVSTTGFTHLMVRVYSLKNNQLVFSADGSEPWTGANCEEGMYMVAVEAVTPDGRMVTEGKVVWLNRTSMN